MNILHTVEFYEPSKGGAQEVVKQISERLVRRGHTVTVATSRHPLRTKQSLNGVVVEEFDISGNVVKGIQGRKSEYHNFLRDSRFDIMMNYAAQSWSTDLAFEVLDAITAKKIIAPLGYSRLHVPRYRSYFQKLPRVLQKYDKILYTSPNYQDKHFGDQHGLGEKALIIGNGASREEFELPRESFREKFGIASGPMLLSVSNHYFEKGHGTLLRVFRKLRSENCTLVLIGERPAWHSWYSCWAWCRWHSIVDRRIRILSGISREDVVSAYHEADGFLFSSRTECSPLVMYEAFASRTPFITTNVGNVSDHSDCLRIVASEDQMLVELEQLLSNPEPYQSLAERAYSLFLDGHTWEGIAETYERACRQTLDAQRAVAS